MRRALVPLALAVCSVVAAALLLHTSWLQLLELKLSDLHFLIRGVRPTPDVVLLAVDQKSLDALREPVMFWHPYFAEAIRATARAGARVFGIDFYFAVAVDRWEKGHDAVLSAAVVETAPTMPVICGFLPDRMDPERPALYLYASSMGLAGFMHLPEDRDAFVRRAYLTAVEPGAALPQRSLALRVAEKFLRREIQLAEIPLDRQGALTINYAGPPGTVPRISLIDLLAAARAGRQEQVRAWVQGKAVLLGPDSVVLGDLHATPFFHAGTGTTAGFEIQANIVQSLIRQDFLRHAPAWCWIAIAVLLGGLASAGAYRLALGQAALLTVALGPCALVIAHALFRGGLVVAQTPVLLSIAFAGVTGIATNLESRRKLLAAAFSMFVGRKVAEVVGQGNDISRLSAERRNVTVLFSDIREFTAFCDTTEPSVVLELLNAYLSQLAAVVRRHGGEVNKFMGDGVMAVFTDDDPGAIAGDHASRGVRCALEMLELDSVFQTAVGLHTGEAIIGTLGSSDKLEHTVLGATVNVAARLEEMNKQFSTRLLLSEDTQRLLGNDLPMVDLGETEIRGKAMPVRVFTPAAVAPARFLQDSGKLLSLFCAVLLATAWTAVAAPKEQAAGLILSAGDGSQILRRGAHQPVPARPGDVLFVGDRLRTGKAPATYLYCPAQFSEQLAADTEVVIGQQDVSLESGQAGARKAVGSCLLPRVLRLPDAAQRRLGGLAMRGEERSATSAEPDVPAPLQSRLAELNSRIETNSEDPLPRLARAVEWESAGFFNRAAQDYQELLKVWPDADWIRAKLFELGRPSGN